VTRPAVPHFMADWWRWHSARGEDAYAETLLAGRPLPDAAPEAWHALGELTRAARAPGAAEELAGLGAALAAYAEGARAGAAAGAPVAGPRGLARVAHLSGLSGKVTALTAAVIVPLGGVAAAAYGGHLPDGPQRLAHNVLGAPAPASTVPSGGAAAPVPTPPVGGPSAATPAPAATSALPTATASITPAGDVRLCAVFAAGDLPVGAPDRAGLEARAGGDGKIPSYCAAVAPLPPGRSGAPVGRSLGPGPRGTQAPRLGPSRPGGPGRPGPTPPASPRRHPVTPPAAPVARPTAHPPERPPKPAPKPEPGKPSHSGKPPEPTKPPGDKPPGDKPPGDKPTQHD